MRTAITGLFGALIAAQAAVATANAEDLKRGRDGGMPESLQDRLALTPPRIAAIA